MKILAWYSKLRFRVSIHSVVSLLRRHRKALQLLGTLIVFFTFVLREVLREDARSKKESYDAAEVQFNLRNSLIDLDDKIRHVGFLVLTLSPSSEQPDKWSQAHWDTAHDRIIQTERLLELADNLRKILPRAEVAEIQQTIQKIKLRLPEISDELSAADSSREDLQLRDRNSEWSLVTTHSLGARREALDLFPPLLEKLGKKAKHAQRLYIFFDSSSIALYALGVLLAATGQLLGLDTDSTEN
jgi:hypothetical protein